MSRDPEETFDFLARTYRAVKVLAVGSVAFVGVLVSVAALNLQVSDRWTRSIPLYVVVLVVIAVTVVLGALLITGMLLLRDAITTSSFYRSKALNLQSIVAGLEELAYTDAITGIPNSNALQREIELTRGRPSRCLIMLDLRDFGRINKRYNHWSGDEYLRQFARTIVRTGRRDEYVYKHRDPDVVTIGGEHGRLAGRSAKAFRKNQGSDEFFILLEGSVVDALGYLNRLHRRSSEFETMSQSVLGSVHRFGFHAGIVNIAPNEGHESVVRRVSQCLQLAQDPHHPYYVHWSPDLPPYPAGSRENQILSDMRSALGKA